MQAYFLDISGVTLEKCMKITCYLRILNTADIFKENKIMRMYYQYYILGKN